MTKRILVWFWSGGGGGSQFAVNWARRLAQRFGAGNVALSLRADDPAIARAHTLGLETFAAEVMSNRHRPLASLSGLHTASRVLADHMRRSGAEVAALAMNFATAAPLSLTLRKPLVYCAHDPEPHPGDYAAQAQRATQALLLRRANRVLALSHYAGERLRRRVGAKLEVAPLSAVFAPDPTPPRTEGPVHFLFAGRMIAYKGLDLLADALDRIAARDDWRLTLVGEGPALTDAMLARLRRPQVRHARRAWLSEAELEALIGDCDVLLAPYRSATQSGVVAQALARGKPCLVTPVGALSEQIGAGRAGWIASAADGESVAKTMELLLDDPRARTEKSAAALALARDAWARDYWSWLEAL